MKFPVNRKAASSCLCIHVWQSFCPLTELEEEVVLVFESQIVLHVLGKEFERVETLEVGVIVVSLLVEASLD
jgi:hypothetical protein